LTALLAAGDGGA